MDTLCLDKTGTITNGKLTVDAVMEISAGLSGKALPQGEPEKLVQSYLAASDDNNATFQVLKEAFGGQAFIHRHIRFRFRQSANGDVSVLRERAVFLSARRKS